MQVASENMELHGTQAMELKAPAMNKITKAEKISVNDEDKKGVQVIVPIKPQKKNQGEFGIDYCEMNEDFTEITKIQGTNVSDIEYIFDENTKQFRKAVNIIEKYSIVKKIYYTQNYFGKQYYATWIHLLEGKTAKLCLNTFFVDKSKKVEKNKEFITFKENPNFEIRYGKQVDAQIKIFIEKHNKDYDIEIKALKTFDTTQYIEILDEENLPVGIIGMSPNQVEVLEVKIVPVIISHFITEESKADLLRKANELYASINKNEIIKKLNNHSLNQAGIQCKLMTDHKNIEYISVRTHDYYKNYWDNTNSKLKDFTLTTEQEKNDFYREVPKDEDGDTNRGVTKDLLLDKLERDYFKKYGNSFKGAIIFVTESEYIDENGKEDTGGYSQVIPIKNQGTIIFGNNIKNSYTYAHELGHMLGLQHTFIKDEKELNDLNETIKNYIQNENKIIVSIEQNKETIKDYENRIMERNKEIEELKISIGKSKEKKQLTKEEMYDIKENERFIVEKEKNIIEYQNEINYYSEQINILNLST